LGDGFMVLVTRKGKYTNPMGYCCNRSYIVRYGKWHSWDQLKVSHDFLSTNKVIQN